jgi:hypothetical protein
MGRFVWPSALFLVTVVAGSPQLAAGAPLAPTRASQIVNLVAATPCGAYGFAGFGIRMNPDATSSPFTIPPGYVLVVTQLEASDLSGTLTPGTTVQIQLVDGNTGVWFGASVDTVVNPDGKFAVVGSVSNLVIKPGVLLCRFGLGPTVFAAVRGFLAKDN